MNNEPQGRFARYAIPALGLFLVLTVAPIFYTTSMRDVFTLSKAIPIAIGVCLMWLAIAKTGDITFKRSLTPGIAAMAAVTLVSALFSVDYPLSIMGPHQQQFYALLPLSLCALAYYASSNAEEVPTSVLVLLALLGGVVVSLLALTQINGGGFQAWSIQGGGRAGSTFGSPAFLGVYLAFLLPLAWAENRSRKSWVVIAIIAAGLVATRSRGSILAAASGIALIEMIRGTKLSKVLGIIMSACVVVGVVLLYRKTAGASDVGRFEVWKIALKAWTAHPIFGWGPDTFSLAFRQFMTKRFIESSNGSEIFVHYSAHNDVLQVLATLGLVGLAAYAFLSMAVVRMLRKVVGVDETLGIAGAMAAMFVNAKFNPIPLAVMAVAACLLGSLDRSRFYDERENQKPLAGLVAALSLVLLLVVTGMCRAEMHQRRGEDMRQTMGREVEAAEQFNIAAQINPFDLWYTQRQLDYFWLIIPKMPGVNRDQLAAFSHNVSENIGRLHPNDPTAHELRAISYKFEGDMLGRDRLWEALHEMEVAERLAPHFSKYHEQSAALIELRRHQ